MRCAVAGFLLGMLAFVAHAQDAHTIKPYKLKVGDATKITKTEDSSNTIGIKDKGGNPIQEVKEKATKAQTYVETVVELPDPNKKPTKLKRVYEKSEQEQNGKPQTDSFVGKAVLIEKKGEKYIFKIEGGAAITGAEAEKLDREFNKKEQDKGLDELLFPTKPVKVGEAWTPDGENLLKSLNAAGDLVASKVAANAKLTKVYEKNGQKFGVMEIVMDIQVKAVGEGAQQLELAPPGNLKMKGVMDICIDGTANAGVATFDLLFDADSKFSVSGKEAGLIAIKGGGKLSETRAQVSGK